MLQEILIEEHESTLKGKGVKEVPSPASVLHVDYLSDTCSRSSSQPTEESASSSTPGVPILPCTYIGVLVIKQVLRLNAMSALFYRATMQGKQQSLHTEHRHSALALQRDEMPEHMRLADSVGGRGRDLRYVAHAQCSGTTGRTGRASSRGATAAQGARLTCARRASCARALRAPGCAALSASACRRCSTASLPHSWVSATPDIPGLYCLSVAGQRQGTGPHVCWYISQFINMDGS